MEFLWTISENSFGRWPVYQQYKANSRSSAHRKRRQVDSECEQTVKSFYLIETNGEVTCIATEDSFDFKLSELRNTVVKLLE